MNSLNLDNGKLAATYDELSDSQFEGGKRLLEHLEVSHNNTVLDLGCGTGRLAFHVAETVGASGHVLGIDPLPERIAVARRKNLYPNVAFRVGVAEDLSTIEAASVDVVYLSAVFHWIANKAGALREIFRVLKNGGRLGITTNAKELINQTTLAKVTAKVFAREPYAGYVEPCDFAPARFGVTTSELVSLLVESNLSIRLLRVSPVCRTYANGARIVDFAESSTFGNYTGRLPEELRAQARIDIANEFDRLRIRNGGIEVAGYTVFAIATKVDVGQSGSRASKTSN